MPSILRIVTPSSFETIRTFFFPLQSWAETAIATLDSGDPEFVAGDVEMIVWYGILFKFDLTCSEFHEILYN